MKPEITDISYSTALTYELVTRYGFLTLGAPTFPSLKREAIYKPRTDSTVIPTFLQYRLGDHIVGTAAALKGYWGVPYYRFLIQPKNKIRRHQLLYNLESLNHLVFYIAPEFYSISGLFDAVMGTAVLANSTFWSPQAIGTLPEPERYLLAFKPGATYGVLQPRSIKIERTLKGEAFLEAIKARFDAGQFETYDEQRLLSLGDEMLNNYVEVFDTPKVPRLIEDIKKGRERIDARDYLSLISTLLYDCFVYFVSGD